MSGWFLLGYLVGVFVCTWCIGYAVGREGLDEQPGAVFVLAALWPAAALIAIPALIYSAGRKRGADRRMRERELRERIAELERELQLND